MSHIWINHNESFTSKNECEVAITNSTCTACGNSLDNSSLADNLLFWVGGLLPFVLALLGYIGNLLSIYILSRPRIISTFNRLLIVLAYVCFLYPFQQIFQASSILMIFIISFDRYVAIIHPFYVDDANNIIRTFMLGPTRKMLFSTS